jgi:hypothetical protein
MCISYATEMKRTRLGLATFDIRGHGCPKEGVILLSPRPTHVHKSNYKTSFHKKSRHRIGVSTSVCGSFEALKTQVRVLLTAKKLSFVFFGESFFFLV